MKRVLEMKRVLALIGALTALALTGIAAAGALADDPDFAGGYGSNDDPALADGHDGYGFACKDTDTVPTGELPFPGPLPPMESSGGSGGGVGPMDGPNGGDGIPGTLWGYKDIAVKRYCDGRVLLNINVLAHYPGARLTECKIDSVVSDIRLGPSGKIIKTMVSSRLITLIPQSDDLMYGPHLLIARGLPAGTYESHLVLIKIKGTAPDGTPYAPTRQPLITHTFTIP